jgi:hypothetical protein
MKHLILVLTIFWVCVSALGPVAATANQPPPVGGVLPDIVLDVPQNPELQSYLGISGKKTFRIPEIQTEVVIIEIFSMY